MNEFAKNRSMMTCYLVDDEYPAIERLKYLIESFLKPVLKVIGDTTNPAIAEVQIIKSHPDLVFLDIEMPGVTGLDFARIIKDKGFTGEIVYVTAYDHYAIKAIRSEAFDYLLKPVDVDYLKQCVERMAVKIDTRPSDKLAEVYELSKRELEVVRFLLAGDTSNDIANKLFLSKHTVDTHRRNILTKTGARNTIELINLFSS